MEKGAPETVRPFLVGGGGGGEVLGALDNLEVLDNLDSLDGIGWT